MPNDDAVSTVTSPKRRLNTVTKPLAEHLVKEWHPTKNGELKAHQLNAGANRKVWWLGECGHEWEAKVFDRSQGRGCSYCSGKYLLRGFNDLLTLKPLVASQFHPTKNGTLNVDEIMVGSNKKVWWLNADCGHEWEMKVATRNDHVPCSVCDGFTFLAGFNDLATMHPEILSEWDYQKNTISPTEITSGSSLKAWWIGKACGHSWDAKIANRILINRGCPVCSGNMVLVGFNDILTLNPEITQEWHPTKNLPLTPISITAGSGKKVWWQCIKKHEWKTTVSSRVSGGHACPYCTGRNVIIGETDLVTLNPVLAAEWHPVKNPSLNPHEISPGSSKRVWWQCKKGHEWQSQVNWRNNGNGCSTCSSRNYISKAEQEIADFLTSCGLKIEQTNKKILSGLELDIYIPAKKLAIEYNGLYWHSELKTADTHYHYNKWSKAKNKGIQLIQVWEDDWNRNPEGVKNMLLDKLGRRKPEKIFARNTSITEVGEPDAKDFFKENQIQEFTGSSTYIGLKEKEELVSVIALDKSDNNSLMIVNYATTKNVIGGFSKILEYIEVVFSPKQLVFFSDNCIPNDKEFALSGFTEQEVLEPNYKYVVKFKRKPKEEYMASRFRDDPNLKWEEGLTEKELASLNGIPRIWDAGKTKWIKQVVK